LRLVVILNSPIVILPPQAAVFRELRRRDRFFNFFFNFG
jgi:hypothetical protein